VVFCVYLITSLRAITWFVFAGWMVVGLLVYFFYSRTHSTAPSTRPVPLADEDASVQLRDRSMTSGTIIGVILIFLTAVSAVVFGANQEGLETWQKLMWWATAVLAVVGGLMALRGLADDRQAASHAVAGEYKQAAGKMRGAILSIAIWLVIPGLLAVLSARFAVPPDEAAAEEAASAAGGPAIVSTAPVNPG
jgi:C-terminus of AA_permease